MSEVSVEQLDGIKKNIAVVYSGEFIDGTQSSTISIKIFDENPDKISTIDNTAFKRVTLSDEYIGIIEFIFPNSNQNEPNHSPSQVEARKIFESGTSATGRPGIWDEASKRFIASHSGEIITVTPNASLERTFVLTELPEAMANPNITKINGIDIDILRTAYNNDIANGLSPTQAHENLAHAVNAKSADIWHNSPVYEYTNPDGTVSRTIGIGKGLESSGLGHLNAGDTIGSEAGRINFLKNHPSPEDLAAGAKYLHRFGVLGTLLGTAIAAKDAMAAVERGDVQGAFDILKEFLASEAGGALGGILVTRIAAAVVGGLVLTGPMGWVAGGVVLVLSVGASYLGSEYAEDILDGFVSFAEDLWNDPAEALSMLPDDIMQQLQEISPAVANFINSFLLGTAATPLGLAAAMSSILAHFAQSIIDPIILDLGGNGVNLTPLATSNALFDLHGTGFAVHTGWVGPDDGFLVVDRNGDGIVNGISELFGNAEIGGFAALSALDSNGDGVINALDPEFASLKLWVDADGDGQTDAGELKTLAQHGITAINLAATPIEHMVNGNMIGALGSYQRANGSTGEVAEAYFANDTALSRYEGDIEYDPDVVALPNLRGYGTVPDLWIAMSLDPVLKSLVQDLDAQTVADKAALTAAVLPILYRWAGVETIAAGSRGPYVDARKLAVLEKFVGQSYNFRGNDDPLFRHQGNLLEGAFDTLATAVGTRLMIFGSMHQVFSEIGHDFAADTFILPSGFANLPALLANDAPADLDAAADYWGQWGAARTLLEELTKGLGLPNGNVWNDFQATFATQNLPFTLEQAIYNRVFVGTAENESLSGTASGDFLMGRAGDDVLSGGVGNDTYFFTRGDGNDRIADKGAASDHDTLVLGDIAAAEVRVIQHADKLILLVNDGADGRIDLTDQFAEHGGIERVVFGNGAIWTKADLLARAEPSDGTIVTHLGTLGNDIVEGSAVGDLIDGRAGDDTLAGGTGDDTYLYARHNGNDTIVEGIDGGKADRLHLRGIDPAAVTLSADGNDIIVTVAESTAGAGDGGTITLKDGFLSGGYGGVEAIVFDNGTSLRPTAIDVWLDRGRIDARVAVTLIVANLVEGLATAPETVTPASVEAVGILLPAALQFLTEDLGPFLTTVFEDGVVPLFTGDFAALGPGLVAVLHDLGLVVEGTAEIVLPALGEAVGILLPVLSDFLLTDAVPAISQKLIVEGLIPALAGDFDTLETLLGDTFEFAVPALTGAVDTLVGPVTTVVVDDVVPLAQDVLTDTVAPLLTGAAVADPGAWLSGTLTGLLGNLGHVVAGVGETVVPAVGTVLGDLLPATADFVGDVLPVIGDLVADDIVPALTMGAEGPQAAADDLFEFAAPVLSDVVGGAVSVTTSLLVDDILPIVSDIIVDGVAPVLSGDLGGLLPTLGGAVGGLLSSVADVVTDDLPGLFGWGRTSVLKNKFLSWHGDDFRIL